MATDGITQARNMYKLKRAKSILAHQEKFSDIINESMDKMKEAFDDYAGTIAKDVGMHRDLALEMLLNHFSHNLQRSLDRFVDKSMDEAWNKFDRNGDGNLQKTEMRELVKMLFQMIGESLPAMVEASIAPAAEDWKHSMGLTTSSAPLQVGKDRSGWTVTADPMQVAAGKLSLLLTQLLQGLEMNAGEISDELFLMVDINKDGAVTRGEFVHSFAEAFSSIVDFGQITRHLLQERAKWQAAQPALARRGTTMLGVGDEGPSLGSFVACVGSLALLATVGYQLASRRKR